MAQDLGTKFRNLHAQAFDQITLDDDTTLYTASRIVRLALRTYCNAKTYLKEEQYLGKDEIKHWETLKVSSLALLQDASAELPGLIMAEQMDGKGVNTFIRVAELCAEVASVMQAEKMTDRVARASTVNLSVGIDERELEDLASYDIIKTDIKLRNLYEQDSGK